MKKLVVLLTMAFFASTAFALIDDGVSSLGVYFDDGTWDYICASVPSYVPYHLYFVMAHCEFPSIAGFEFAWRFDPAPTPASLILAVTLPPTALNAGTSDNFHVGLGTPLLTGDATLLVDLTLLNLAIMENTFITAGPAIPASIPGHAVFSNGADLSQLAVMNWATVDGVQVIVDPSGWVVPMLGGLNIFCGPDIANENATWGIVKALYQ